MKKKATKDIIILLVAIVTLAAAALNLHVSLNMLGKKD